MRNITENFSLENNFWDFNPQFKIVSPFKETFNADKSRGKKSTSNIMWAIALCDHPKSDIYNLKEKEKRVFEMVKDKTFELEDYTEHREIFADMCLTQAEKSIVVWDKRLIDRNRFLASQEYHMGYSEIVKGEDGEAVTRDYKPNVKDLDEMVGRTPKLYLDYFKIKKDLAQDETIKKGKGDKNLSESDSGQI